MVAWMDRAAVEATLATGLTHFWSRSRQSLWRKGETSGHTQHVQGVYADCDADTLLVQVHQDGVACHTGNRTCFFRSIEGSSSAEAPAPATMLERLERIVAARKASPPPNSYVGALLAGVRRRCVADRRGGGVVTAALGGEGDDRVVSRLADLWFHTVVLLGARGLSVPRLHQSPDQDDWGARRAPLSPGATRRALPSGRFSDCGGSAAGIGVAVILAGCAGRRPDTRTGRARATA
jgi:phosphoribosyl-ATP pyrophosphohydrolase/phosphoribosyl-AMP cyclohydrolase